MNFLAFPLVNFFFNLAQLWPHTIPIKYPIFVKICRSQVGANLIYLELQITEYWKNCLNNLDFLQIQNVRQYHLRDVTKHEKISPKESINIKEFRLKWGIYRPVIRWDVAMVMALIQKLTTKK